MQPSLNTVVFNEAHRIVGLLEHCAPYCDELIVVDQSSTDGTADLARDFGATVIPDMAHGYPEASRPLAAEHTDNPWLLLLDADEVLFAEKIPELLDLDERWDGVSMARLTLVDGERFTDRPDYQLRYFRQGTVEYAPAVHHRNAMKPCTAMFRTPRNDPWILHTKTKVEQDADSSRWNALRPDLVP